MDPSTFPVRLNEWIAAISITLPSIVGLIILMYTQISRLRDAIGELHRDVQQVNHNITNGTLKATVKEAISESNQSDTLTTPASTGVDNGVPG